jgi:hypothetical protein
MSGVPGEVNDNPNPIEPGESINFPKPAINPYGSIQRLSGTSSYEFVLPANGVFEVTYEVTIQNTGELVVVLNGTELSMTVVGKAGGGQIVGIAIVSTPAGTPSILSISNPSSAAAGGLKVDEATGALTLPLSCHLIIKQLF